jgi:hypothetical protein
MSFGNVLPLAYSCEGFVVDVENIEIKSDERAHQCRFIVRKTAFLQLR